MGVFCSVEEADDDNEAEGGGGAAREKKTGCKAAGESSVIETEWRIVGVAGSSEWFGEGGKKRSCWSERGGSVGGGRIGGGR